MRKIKGFTLPEIMTIVVIIVLLAAIAIPNMLRARINTREASAVSSMRAISTAANVYRANNPTYPANLAVLGPPDADTGGGGSFYCAAVAQMSYLDAQLGCADQLDKDSNPCVKDGYGFWLEGTTNTFTAGAMPQYWWRSGQKNFFVDESGVIRFNTDRPGGRGQRWYLVVTRENTIPLE